MSCAIFSLDLSNGRCKTMGTTSDILHYHSTFDDTWSLYQYYTESDYLRECEPSVHSICLLDGTSDQAKVSTNYQIAKNMFDLKISVITTSYEQVKDINYCLLSL